MPSFLYAAPGPNMTGVYMAPSPQDPFRPFAPSPICPFQGQPAPLTEEGMRRVLREVLAELLENAEPKSRKRKPRKATRKR